MSGGVGGRRVRPRWAGRKYLLCESFVSDLVTGDVLRKNFVRERPNFVLQDVRSYVSGRWWGGRLPSSGCGHGHDVIVRPPPAGGGGQGASSPPVRLPGGPTFWRELVCDLDFWRDQVASSFRPSSE